MINKKSKGDQALAIQEKIDNLIDKLEKLGFEFMWYNRISGIRRKRVNYNDGYVNASGSYE